MSLDITTQLLFHGGDRDSAPAKLVPTSQFRFRQKERLMSVYVPGADGEPEPARFGHHQFGDTKLIATADEMEIYALITLLAAVTGLRLRKLENHGLPDTIIYEVVDPPPEPPVRRRRSLLRAPIT